MLRPALGVLLPAASLATLSFGAQSSALLAPGDRPHGQCGPDAPSARFALGAAAFGLGFLINLLLSGGAADF